MHRSAYPLQLEHPLERRGTAIELEGHRQPHRIGPHRDRLRQRQLGVEADRHAGARLEPVVATVGLHMPLHPAVLAGPAALLRHERLPVGGASAAARPELQSATTTTRSRHKEDGTR